MSKATYVHIVDEDCTRRATMARQLYQRRVHAEIHETFKELIDLSPSRGVVLVNDDGERIDLKARLQAMRLEGEYLPVAMFSTEVSAKKIVEAMSSGALDYFKWPCSPDLLVETVDRLSEAGEAKARTERQRAEARQLVSCLSPREKDVLKALVNGASNKQMAQELGISPRTVEIHRSNMMSRLNGQSVADVVRIGLYAAVDQ